MEAFEYAVMRVVPRIDRGESMNAGVLLYCQGLDFLKARTMLDRQRLAALDPHANADQIELALQAATRCTPQDGEDLGRRFRWLTAPRSTVVQPGPIHTGLTVDPHAQLGRLFMVLVDRVT
jgi:hypothetical protein